MATTTIVRIREETVQGGREEIERDT